MMTQELMGSALLEESADILEASPHLAKGYLSDFLGGYCAMGAINMAHHGSPLYPEGMLSPDLPYLTSVGLTYDPHNKDNPRSRLVAWNNSPLTTKEMVISHFRAMAAELRAKEQPDILPLEGADIGKEIEIIEVVPAETPVLPVVPAEPAAPAETPVQEPVPV